jgi:hypothetical protein
MLPLLVQFGCTISSRENSISVINVIALNLNDPVEQKGAQSTEQNYDIVLTEDELATLENASNRILLAV